jgi:hypothetical protein
MNRNEAFRILENEGLKYYKWFDKHGIKPNQVIIYEEDNKWVVCAADERACIADTSYSYYDDENKALDDFIERVRLEKILLKD